MFGQLTSSADQPFRLLSDKSFPQKFVTHEAKDTSPLDRCNGSSDGSTTSSCSSSLESQPPVAGLLKRKEMSTASTPPPIHREHQAAGTEGLAAHIDKMRLTPSIAAAAAASIPSRHHKVPHASSAAPYSSSAAYAAAASAPAASTSQHQHTNQAHAASEPVAHTLPPSMMTPSLKRLLEAARHCNLPPSPRTPEPGTPNYPTIMLSLSHGVPPAMQRPNWCLDDYIFLEKLYTGYSSTVFKGICKRSQQVVVLKVYTLSSVCDLYKYQIYREVRVHAALQHENIVHLYASFQEGEKIVLVEEYIDGCDLFTLLHRYGGRMTERLAVQLVLEPFLTVLSFLHSKGIIHRDIKPENIMFTKGMTLKLGDFGLAIDLREERAVTRAGTLDYMAPEVLRCPFKSRPEENKDNGFLQYSAGVDSWALGVLTYELLVGYPPFFDQSRHGTEERIISSNPAYPDTLSAEALAFVQTSLDKDPARRPSIHQMLHSQWVDAHRTRRSMRTVASGEVTAAAVPESEAAEAPHRPLQHAMTACVADKVTQASQMIVTSGIPVSSSPAAPLPSSSTAALNCSPAPIKTIPSAPASTPVSKPQPAPAACASPSVPVPVLPFQGNLASILATLGSNSPRHPSPASACLGLSPRAPVNHQPAAASTPRSPLSSSKPPHYFFNSPFVPLASTASPGPAVVCSPRSVYDPTPSVSASPGPSLDAALSLGSCGSIDPLQQQQMEAVAPSQQFMARFSGVSVSVEGLSGLSAALGASATER